MKWRCAQAGRADGKVDLNLRFRVLLKKGLTTDTLSAVLLLGANRRGLRPGFLPIQRSAPRCHASLYDCKSKFWNNRMQEYCLCRPIETWTRVSTAIPMNHS